MKHFVKTFFIFVGIIAIGMVGVILVNYFEADIESASNGENKAQVVE